jgi:transcriptional regulator with XRE-family HTH domain
MEESLGPLLTRVRLGRGWSQLRVAELLCATSGAPTVTRHEISRWEREERIPSGFWLGWLALVLEVPVDTLTAAAALARRRRPTRPAWERLDTKLAESTLKDLAVER